MEKWWKSFEAWLIILIFVAVFAIIVFFVSRDFKEAREKDSRGECVRTQPVVVASGSIYNSSGLFSSGPAEYYLRFEGKTSKSGEACEILTRVTESRFNRSMY